MRKRCAFNKTAVIRGGAMDMERNSMNLGRVPGIDEVSPPVSEGDRERRFGLDCT